MANPQENLTRQEMIDLLTVEAPRPSIEQKVRSYVTYREIGGTALPKYVEQLLAEVKASYDNEHTDTD